MKDIQVGDTITVYNEFYKASGDYKILFIPAEPGVPWVVRELFEPNRKWRLWTEGLITKTFTR